MRGNYNRRDHQNYSRNANHSCSRNDSRDDKQNDIRNYSRKSTRKPDNEGPASRPEDEKTRARHKALVILTGMDRTEQQLREKLKKAEFSQEAVDDAIAYVSSYHYIDDRRYADHYIEVMRSSRSLRRIEMDLMKKGVPRDILQEAMKQAAEEDGSEFELALRLAEKKLKGRPPVDDRERQKLYAYLMRQGFSGRDVVKVMNSSLVTGTYD